MKNLDAMISFLGWAALTYAWLDINFTFASAICQAISDHNDSIRQEAIQELEYDADDEDTDEDET